MGRFRMLGTVLLVAGVAVIGGGLAAGAGTGRPERAAAELPPARAGHVVVVGVAGLRWSDVNPDDTPALAGLARRGSVGTLSVRSAAPVTCPADGWLTLGAGGYATPDPDRAGAGCGSRLPPPVATTGPAVPVMPELRGRNGGARLGTRPGTLGEQLPCTSAIGPGAALATAGPDGHIDHYDPALPADLSGALARCSFTAVDLGSVDGAAEDRRRDLRSFDRALALVRDSAPPGSVLLVLGVAETDHRQPRLHVAVADGPGFGEACEPNRHGCGEPNRPDHGPGWLWSPSTRRLPYLQLVDVAPTVLSVLGREVPDGLPGRPLAGGAPGRPEPFPATVAALVDADTQAVAQRSVLGRFFSCFGVALLLALVATWWLVHRRRRGRPTPPALHRWLGVAALGLAAVPAATFAANLVPWWRSATPALAVAAAVTAAALTIAALAIAAAVTRPVRWLAGTSGAVGVLGVTTLGILAVDAVTGARLQLSSLLGYNPLVAGRFVGFGNLAFAVYAVGGVLLAAFLAYGHRPTAVWARLAAVAVPVVVVDGMPWWGEDFGGVLTLVPTFVVLGLLLARARVTWWRVAVAAVGGVAVVLAISWLDYLRPAGSRSHFGRFVVAMLDGTAMQTVRRKLLANAELLTLGPHTVLAALLVIVGVVLVFRPPPALQRVYHTWPVVRPALTATAALAGFGFATNDSGIAIPVVVALVMLPAVLALCCASTAVAATGGPVPATPPGAGAGAWNAPRPPPEERPRARSGTPAR